MRGFSFVLPLVLVAFASVSGCGRLHFTRHPPPDAAADGAMDSSPPASDGGTDVGLDSSVRVDGALDSGSSGDSGETDAGGTGDAGDGAVMADASLPPGRVTVRDLRAEWATEASVYWSWAFTGAAADFDRFEIVTGPTEAAVLARDATTKTTGPAENPELGFLTLPGGSDRVDRTLTFEHPAGSAVFAQLIAYDTVGGADASLIASATTLAPTREIVIFADANTAGYSLPMRFRYTAGGAYRGTHCYAYDSVCGTPTECFDNLRRQDVGIDLSAIPAAAFDRAFYEFAVEIDGVGAEPSYWSEARVSFASGAIYAFSWLTLPARAGYRVIQIPLNQLNWAGSNLDHATTTATNLNMFWIGGGWTNGATVRFDEARIRW